MAWLSRFLAGFTRNWADTDEPGDFAPQPADLPLAPADALERVEAAVRSLPCWRLVAVQRKAGVLYASRRTRLWGFIDDITVRVAPAAGGSRIHARSQSRVGKGDLGQNRRNLRELFAILGSSSSAT